MSKNYVPFIHNYCDRWCERCPFTDRCHVFEEESTLAPEAKDMNHDAFWDRLTANFQKTIDLLHEMAADLGIDLEAAKFEQAELAQPGEAATEAEKEKPQSEKARQAERLERRTKRYIKLVDRFFDLNQDFFEQKQADLKQRLGMNIAVDVPAFERLKDAFEVIRFYQFFISAKTVRSLSGFEFDHAFEGDDPDELQSDMNGSAKIAHLAIEKSLAAWETVREHFPEKTDELLDQFAVLQKIQRDLLAFFPRCLEFVRPGFDEPSEVAEKAERASSQA